MYIVLVNSATMLDSPALHFNGKNKEEEEEAYNDWWTTSVLFYPSGGFADLGFLARGVKFTKGFWRFGVFPRTADKLPNSGNFLSALSDILARPDDTSSRSLAFRPLHHG